MLKILSTLWGVDRGTRDRREKKGKRESKFHCPLGPCMWPGIQKQYSGGSYTVSRHLWSPLGSPSALQARALGLENPFPRQPPHWHTRLAQAPEGWGWALLRLSGYIHGALLVSSVLLLFISVFFF